MEERGSARDGERESGGEEEEESKVSPSINRRSWRSITTGENPDPSNRDTDHVTFGVIPVRSSPAPGGRVTRKSFHSPSSSKLELQNPTDRLLSPKMARNSQNETHNVGSRVDLRADERKDVELTVGDVVTGDGGSQWIAAASKGCRDAGNHVWKFCPFFSLDFLLQSFGFRLFSSIILSSPLFPHLRLLLSLSQSLLLILFSLFVALTTSNGPATQSLPYLL